MVPTPALAPAPAPAQVLVAATNAHGSSVMMPPGLLATKLEQQHVAAAAQIQADKHPIPLGASELAVLGGPRNAPAVASGPSPAPPLLGPGLQSRGGRASVGSRAATGLPMMPSADMLASMATEAPKKSKSKGKGKGKGSDSDEDDDSDDNDAPASAPAVDVASAVAGVKARRRSRGR